MHQRLYGMTLAGLWRTGYTFYDEAGETVTMRFAGGRQPVDIGQKPGYHCLQKAPDEMNIKELSRHMEILRSQGKDTLS